MTAFSHFQGHSNDDSIASPKQRSFSTHHDLSQHVQITQLYSNEVRHILSSASSTRRISEKVEQNHILKNKNVNAGKHNKLRNQECSQNHENGEVLKKSLKLAKNVTQQCMTKLLILVSM